MSDLPVPRTFEQRLLDLEQRSVAPLSRHTTAGSAKVNAGAGGVKPSSVMADLDVFQIAYVGALQMADLRWPDTMLQADGSPPDPAEVLHAGDKWFEQPTVGQVHTWRIVVDLTKANSLSGLLALVISNPVSGFVITQPLPVDSSAGGLVLAQETLVIPTVADFASIRPPIGGGGGYDLSLVWQKELGQGDLTVTVESVTVLYSST